MPYTKTTWTNETPQSSPVKYQVNDDTNGIIAASATITPVTTITPGTPLDSTNLNKIEEGIRVAQETAEAQVITSKLVDGILSADAAGRAKMADGFVTLAKLASGLLFQKLFEFVGDGVNLPDWTSIPQTFRHLIMIYTGVSSRTTAGYDSVNMRVNNDISTNYQTHVANYNQPGTQWYFDYGSTNPHNEGLHIGALPAQNVGNLPPGSGLVVFPDYSGETFYKSCFAFITLIGSYMGTPGFLLSTSMRLNNEPITRLTGYMSGVYFPRTGSIFSLYGFN